MAAEQRARGAPPVGGVFVLGAALAQTSHAFARVERAAAGGAAGDAEEEEPRPPLLVVSGGADRVVKPRWVVETAQRLRAHAQEMTLEIIPGLGHELQVLSGAERGGVAPSYPSLAWVVLARSTSL